jgi:predicted amidohydrolase
MEGLMTANKNFKRQVRTRASKTGESYSTALHHLRGGGVPNAAQTPLAIRIAVAQSRVPTDLTDSAGLRSAGVEIRQLMGEARSAGVRLLHLCEGALCAPAKNVISRNPIEVAATDWDRCAWTILKDEITEIARLAAELKLWVVLGSVHRLTGGQRPHNSLFVISDRGHIVTRYDERMLSNTKLTYMYTPGSAPIAFDVDGVRFGCALGMEAVFPEIFLEYERLDVDCVLFSTHGAGGPGGTDSNSGPFALQSQAHAAANSYWVSYAGLTQDAPNGPAGIVSPTGDWVARCGRDQSSALVVADVGNSPENRARPWRRTARGGIYDRYRARNDPRSDHRAGL